MRHHLPTGEKVDTGSHIKGNSSFSFIHDGIIYSRSEGQDAYEIWQYDISTDTTTRIMTSERDLYAYNAIGDQLLVGERCRETHEETLYLYDLTQKESSILETYPVDHINVHVVHDWIIVKHTDMVNSGDTCYEFYDVDGTYVGKVREWDGVWVE